MGCRAFVIACGRFVATEIALLEVSSSIIDLMRSFFVYVYISSNSVRSTVGKSYSKLSSGLVNRLRVIQIWADEPLLKPTFATEL